MIVSILVTGVKFGDDKSSLYEENKSDTELNMETKTRLRLLATSKSGTHWEPRDQGLDGGLVSSLRALL